MELMLLKRIVMNLKKLYVKKMVLLRMDMIMMNILMPQQNKEVEEHI
jgi:hypothetical protein